MSLWGEGHGFRFSGFWSLQDLSFRVEVLRVLGRGFRGQGLTFGTTAISRCLV